MPQLPAAFEGLKSLVLVLCGVAELHLYTGMSVVLGFNVQGKVLTSTAKVYFL